MDRYLKTRSITGLDIGTTKVCALIANVTDDGLDQRDIEIVGVGVVPSTGVKKGVVTDVDATIQAVEQAIDQAATQSGQEVCSVYVGVTGAHFESRNRVASVTIASPSHGVVERDIERVLLESKRFDLPADRHILHALPHSFSIDGHPDIHNPVGMSGTRLEVTTHIIHGLTAMLNNLGKCVTGSGLDVGEMVLQPLASAESVLLPEEKELGVCLLDIGGGTSDLAVFAAGAIFHSAVIPVGGNHVTSDIAYGLTVGMEEAERLKTQSGNARVGLISEDDVVNVKQVGRDTARKLRRRALVQIIEPRMEELFQLVKDELVSSGSIDMIPAGIVLTGGGSLLAGCTEMAQEVFDRPIRIGSPIEVGGLGNTLTHPMYSTAVGLVHYGARQTAVKLAAPVTEEPIRSMYDQFVRLVKRRFPH